MITPVHTLSRTQTQSHVTPVPVVGFCRQPSVIFPPSDTNHRSDTVSNAGLLTDEPGVGNRDMITSDSNVNNAVGCEVFEENIND